MKLLQELVESTKVVQLDEGAMKLKLYNIVHAAVLSAFKPNVTRQKNLEATIKELEKNSEIASNLNGKDIQTMIEDMLDSRIESVLYGKIAAAYALDRKTVRQEAEKDAAAMRALNHLSAEQKEDLINRLITSLKFDTKLKTVKESEGGLDGLYQALQNAKSEMRILFQDGALSDEAASTWRMILDNLMRAVRKEDIEEFKKLYNEYAKERPDAFEAIMDTVYGYLGVTTYEELAKKTLSEAKVAPIVVDGYELHLDDSDQVHLLNPKKTIRVTMPLTNWVKLAKQSISRFG